MIKFDFETYNNIKIDNYDLTYLKNKFLSDNNMTDWYKLDIDTNKIQECALNIKKDCEVFIIVGIGGSYLGARAIIEALTPYFKNSSPEILYLGNNLSSDYIYELMEYIKNKNVYVNVISKSGETLETILSFDILYKYMKNTYCDYKNRIIVTTNDFNGYLYELAKEEKFTTFYIGNTVGRYSALSSVALLPASVAGINIDSLLTGARRARNNLDECYKYTVLRDRIYKSNKLVESFDIYEPKLYYFTEWLKQLYAESQGKNNKGILPISTVNTRDLHSLGQYYQQGTPILFSTTIFCNSDKTINIDKYNKTMNEINLNAMKSVVNAHYNHMNTSIIYLDKLNEENLGYLIFFFEVSAMLGSYLLNINYYDQPGVNNYKELLIKAINERN